MRDRLSRFGLGALVGLLAAAAAVGVGEAVAAFVRPAASPIIVVGNRVVLFTPEPVSRWAIRTFGSDDKRVLLGGTYVIIGLLAVVVGVLALRRLWFGLLGLGLFGAVGVYSALTVHAHRPGDVVPTVVATGAGMYVLWLLLRPVDPHPAADGGGRVHGGGPRVTDRRLFLQGSIAAAALAAVAGFGGRALQHTRFNATAARARVTLPAPGIAAQPEPSGADLGQALPWATPSADFYRVDTALTIPQLDPASWKLRVHGMVENELELTYAELLARPQLERWITMACVSNEVGGNLIGNARFQGTLLADVLKDAGIQAGADQLVMTSSDGMTIGTPVAAVMDGRDALLAVGMNGSPLPIEHGFPVRVVVPGLYGYVSACKWVVDINVTTFARFDAYWVQLGWDQQEPVQLSSRIDTPSSGRSVTVGKPVPIAGVAWEQHVGVGQVEVQVDGGSWLPARLAADVSVDTWRQWVLPWTPTATGPHTIRVRATDAAGRLQNPAEHEPYPGASSGYHQVTVNARSA